MAQGPLHFQGPPEGPGIVPHRVYRPAEISDLVGGSPSGWRSLIVRGILPSVLVGAGARRQHRAVTGAALQAYLGLGTNTASHGDGSSSIATGEGASKRAPSPLVGERAQ